MCCSLPFVAQGPVGRHDILREGDEILEVNGNVLVGLQHHEAIEVVKNTPSFVQVVVCRVVGEELDGEGAESNPASKCALNNVLYTCV